MGGGKGGSNFDPKGKTDTEIMRFCQSFMTELSKHIGSDTDVPAGDIGVGGREIGFMFGQYKRLKNEFTGVLTGKNTKWGGSLIRPEATGYGTVYFVDEMLKTRNESLEGKIATVSGSGNVAQFACEKLIEMGAKPVTLSDSSGFIYDRDGITQEKIDFVKELKSKRSARISEYAEKYNVEYFEGKRPWSIKCDIALPCATQNELDIKDAKKLLDNGCFVVAEGANMPSTKDAVELFIDKKILFGPGKAANAGGVAVSGIEMSQNSTRIPLTREKVDKLLKEIMERIHTTCVKYGSEKGGFINYVDGANIGGFVRVADSMIDQGIV
jgi:glutamate dehydrogenase/leucine dehydrogenase